MAPRLYHFSDDPNIERFVPRSLPGVQRSRGREWLNGPLVWAIDDWHQPMYLFPRNCPRILLWRLPASTAEDIDAHFGRSQARMLAHIEADRLDELKRATLYHYELPRDSFEDLDDAGMWVSSETVEPLDCSTFDHLDERLREADVELRTLPTLEPLKGIWDTTLHASGIRLRYAVGFD